MAQLGWHVGVPSYRSATAGYWHVALGFNAVTGMQMRNGVSINAKLA